MILGHSTSKALPPWGQGDTSTWVLVHQARQNETALTRGLETLHPNAHLLADERAARDVGFQGDAIVIDPMYAFCTKGSEYLKPTLKTTFDGRIRGPMQPSG